ncbi:MAG TPA: hypothetical protein VK488_04095 [Gaiellaceae bacterium]|nr:hypothetical protein [Gaiellaceae bacterium]
MKTKLGEPHPIPSDIRPRKGWGASFNREAGFAVRVLKYSMSVFVHRRLASRSRSQRATALGRQDAVLAHCISCVGEEWEIRSEPTDSNAVGLVAYTAKGKAIAAGTGKLDRAGNFSFDLQTLYPGMTNAISKIDYKVEGKGNSDGSWSVTGSVTVSDSR